MNKLKSIKKLMDDAIFELHIQLDWYAYLFYPRFEKYYSKGILITGDLKSMNWWFVLREIK